MGDLLDVLRSSMLTEPLPDTSGVTSTDTHRRDSKPPLEATIFEAEAGALSHVISCSSHELSETPLTSKPSLSPLRT